MARQEELGDEVVSMFTYSLTKKVKENVDKLSSSLKSKGEIKTITDVLECSLLWQEVLRDEMNTIQARGYY